MLVCSGCLFRRYSRILTSLLIPRLLPLMISQRKCILGSLICCFNLKRVYITLYLITMKNRSSRFWGRLYIDGWPQPIQFFRAHFGTEPKYGRKRFVFAEPRDACDALENAKVIYHTPTLTLFMWNFILFFHYFYSAHHK